VKDKSSVKFAEEDWVSCSLRRSGSEGMEEEGRRTHAIHLDRRASPVSPMR
jgi:hypothetical protein